MTIQFLNRQWDSVRAHVMKHEADYVVTGTLFTAASLVHYRWGKIGTVVFAIIGLGAYPSLVNHVYPLVKRPISVLQHYDFTAASLAASALAIAITCWIFPPAASAMAAFLAGAILQREWTTSTIIENSQQEISRLQAERDKLKKLAEEFQQDGKALEEGLGAVLGNTEEVKKIVAMHDQTSEAVKGLAETLQHQLTPLRTQMKNLTALCEFVKHHKETSILFQLAQQVREDVTRLSVECARMQQTIESQNSSLQGATEDLHTAAAGLLKTQKQAAELIQYFVP